MKRIIYLFFAVLLSLGCGQPEPGDFERLVIREGRHRATPYTLTWNNDSSLAYEWQTNNTWGYNIQDRDQCDWNKLTGWSFYFRTNHQDAIMVAWRWNLAGYLEFAPYYHEGGRTYWARSDCSGDIEGKIVDPDLKVLQASISDNIETHLIINRDQRYTAISIINQATGAGVFWEYYWNRDLGRVREIYPWFGGNQKAPHDIILGRRLLGRE